MAGRRRARSRPATAAVLLSQFVSASRCLRDAQPAHGHGSARWRPGSASMGSMNCGDLDSSTGRSASTARQVPLAKSSMAVRALGAQPSKQRGSDVVEDVLGDLDRQMAGCSPALQCLAELAVPRLVSEPRQVPRPAPRRTPNAAPGVVERPVGRSRSPRSGRADGPAAGSPSAAPPGRPGDSIATAPAHPRCAGWTRLELQLSRPAPVQRWRSPAGSPEQLDGGESTHLRRRRRLPEACSVGIRERPSDISRSSDARAAVARPAWLRTSPVSARCRSSPASTGSPGSAIAEPHAGPHRQLLAGNHERLVE